MNMLLGLHLTYARTLYIIPEAEGRIALELVLFPLTYLQCKPAVRSLTFPDVTPNYYFVMRSSSIFQFWKIPCYLYNANIDRT